MLEGRAGLITTPIVDELTADVIVSNTYIHKS